MNNKTNIKIIKKFGFKNNRQKMKNQKAYKYK